MKKGKILIYDFGTTAVKTALFDEEIRMIDRITTELHYDYPQDKYVEFDAERYWEIAIKTAREIISRNNSEDSVEIISITSQAETVIPVDNKGNCLQKAMVWLDGRAVEENEDLKKGIDVDSFYRITGLNDMDPIWPINKVKWIKNNKRDVYEKTARFLLLKDYILYRLTGEYVTDPSICSFSGYFDIRQKKWSQYLLDLVDLDVRKLPGIEEAETIIGVLKPEVKEMFCLKNQVQVMNGMLDQCGSAIGAGNIEEGSLTETTGTVLALASTIDNLDLLVKGRVPVVCHGIKDKYLALTFCQTAGIILKWFKDNFCEAEIAEAARSNRDVYDILTEKAKSAPYNMRLTLLPHFCGTTSPVINPDATGVIFGLDLNTQKGDLVKAIMESVAFLLRENFDFLVENGFKINRVRSLGGGARSPLWLQIKSNVLNKEFETIENEESTAQGCAFLAGKVLGLIDNLDEIKKWIKIKEIYSPDSGGVKLYQKKYRLYRDLYAALEEIFKKYR